MELYHSDKRKVKYEGTQIGFFTDIKYIGNDKKTRKSIYECTCKCGNVTTVPHNHLQSGHTTSCGCYRPQQTHGASGTQLYHIWEAMKQRCLNPSNPSYDNYGGRGITIAKEFVDDFVAFKEYMGDRPTNRSSIERLDVNGNYEPGNIVWAEPHQQATNKRKQSNNKTGYTGVYRLMNRKIPYFVARVELNMFSKSKYLNIEKYGEELAYELAVKYRDKFVLEANEAGAMFTENHGK